MGFVKCLFAAVRQLCGRSSCGGKTAVGTPGHPKRPRVPGSTSPCTSWLRGVPSLGTQGRCCRPSFPLLAVAAVGTLSLISGAWGSALEACEGRARGSIPPDCPSSCATFSIKLMGSVYRQDSCLFFFFFFN